MISNKTEAELKKTLCWAGRWAFLGGLWDGVVCALPPIHVIVTEKPDAPLIILCQPHFEDALASGLVEEPFIGKDEAVRRNPRAADVVDVDP